MNRIIVSIDECTDILGKVPRTHHDHKYISEAIKHCDELSRKARASGIHIILATQKIDQSSIPTRIQENMNGRIAMKVKTPENSMRILGNNLASKLAAVQGRAIWSLGSDFTEVQVPFISDSEIEKRIKALEVAMTNEEKSFYPFLDLKTKNKEEVVKSHDDLIES